MSDTSPRYAQSTIAALLHRLGPSSMEALAVYCDIGMAEAEDFAAQVNAMIERGVVVPVSIGGAGREPLWVALAPWQPCRTPMAEFNHLTVWQANKVQALRAKHPDVYVATVKIADYLGCDLEQLRAFMVRNPRPPAVARLSGGGGDLQ